VGFPAKNFIVACLRLLEDLLIHLALGIAQEGVAAPRVVFLIGECVPCTRVTIVGGVFPQVQLTSSQGVVLLVSILLLFVCSFVKLEKF
jgi:hypothetical protein